MNLYDNYMKHYNALATVHNKIACMVGKPGLEDEVAKMLRSSQRLERHAVKIEKFVISLSLSQADIDTRRAMQDVFKSNPIVRRRTVVRLMADPELQKLFKRMDYKARA